ncbi:metallophosphoesterase [Sphingobacterium sp. DK4209]|uniref:Metallophosphoesterase n=1 Tax=Sphingobacterium zhuxiongii TaxID=2662364 RepID=A0A5Q0QJB9_9SPHI|nr:MULTISPECIES: metallophosphoesterase [unclassified Sphingobacterium]MVZ66505.1 metallophosphoesterase [Sphingobacterium sp. DK4209]QGA27840.1 metallophosphoesterase [Sphingobacterium sp. dk4302]
MSKIGPFLTIIIGLMLLSSCDLFDVHPYDGDIKGKRNINQTNIEKIERDLKNQDTIRYALISDSQRWYDELDDFVDFANNRDDLDFIIHAGDLSDFGLTKEFLIQRDILEKLHQPYVALIGNHDVLANGEDIFRIVFGPLNFSFIAGRTKFVCLNTNALESDYSSPIPDFSYIQSEREARKDEFNQTVFVMHAKPTSEQFNNNVNEVFQYSIKQFPNLLYGNHGHDHRYQNEDIFKDGIYYYGTPNIGKRQFLLFTVTQNSYTHEIISF